MTYYKYVGRTKDGELKQGVIQASTKQSAASKLRVQGINTRELAPSNNLLYRDFKIEPKIKNEEFVIFCRQLSTLIRAGVNLVESITIVNEQTKTKSMKKVLNQVEEDIKSGLSFSKSAEKHSRVFPPLFINMVESAEATGDLDNTLDSLANTFEKQYNLKKKVQSSMVYPVGMFILTMVVAAFLMIFLVPSFTKTFEEMGAELPTITLITIAISNILQKFWWIVLSTVISSIFIFTYLYKKIYKVNYLVNLFLLRLPLVGPLLQKALIARLTGTMASLFKSSVPILRILVITDKVVANPVVSKVILESKTNLERGGSLSSAFEKSWVFPTLVTSMLKIGESTGSLDYMLSKVSDFYQADVDRSVDSLKSMIEPVMILVLSVIVGGIVGAIFLPMFSLYEQM